MPCWGSDCHENMVQGESTCLKADCGPLSAAEHQPWFIAPASWRAACSRSFAAGATIVGHACRETKPCALRCPCRSSCQLTIRPFAQPPASDCTTGPRAVGMAASFLSRNGLAITCKISRKRMNPALGQLSHSSIIELGYGKLSVPDPGKIDNFLMDRNLKI